MRVYSLLLLALFPPGTVAQTVSPRALQALTFREIGPANSSGRVVDLAVVEADPATFYVATATGGLWKTTNNGVTFTPLFTNQGTHSIGAIAVHQTDTALVWVGTGERANRQSSSWGDGVYKSIDGGRTWKHMGLRDSHHIGRIALRPDNPDVVYVAAMGHLWGPNAARGLYRSTDGGATWDRVLAVDDNTGVVDVALDPENPAIVYAASYQRRRRPFGFHGGGPGSALWKSTDGGTTWHRLTTGLPAGEYGRIGISIYRRNPAIVYISLEQGWRYNASTAYTERRAGIYRSEDRGETWQHMSDWNPRPMYASQPLVDPNDDQRIYMMNAYSVSEDGGRTFRRVPHRTHGDDRIFWVDPHDSRHVMKGDDGGLGISWDRGKTFLYVTDLPVSQFYRISVDMRDPYRVYGGLQDNGSWAGPNATFRREGILFDDWFRTGGGDGFLSLVDTTDHRTLYVESQYLGLSRFDLVSRTRKAIRPDNARGAIAARRNWDAWGPGTPEPELGNAMAPANWDGPFLISSHDPHTLYAGTNVLWKSTDRGDTWTALGDLTTGVNRRNLTIMGQRANDSTPSLDDGIPYFPTLTAIAESRFTPGVLYAGTDDGRFSVSGDDGAHWTDASDRLPDLPPMAWIAGLEPSHHLRGMVYVTVNNYRNDDYANYVYRCTDRATRCTSIVGDLPPDRVARTLREDPRNPRLLYLGTEFGLFISVDAGLHWVPLRNNMPNVPVNDLVVHPRDNDLVLGTHGRGAWILDQVNALQELTPEVLAARAHLFTVEPATMIRYANTKAHAGDMIFRGTNPPAGAIIDYYLRDPADSAALSLTIRDHGGRTVVALPSTTAAGINRVIWDLHATSPVPSGKGRSAVSGPWVDPGTYIVRLVVDGATWERSVDVGEDPRIELTDAERRAWREALTDLGAQLAEVGPLADSLMELERRLDSLSGSPDPNRTAALRDVGPPFRELRSRLERLYGAVNSWPGPPTTDQMRQATYLSTWRVRLVPRVRALLDAVPR